MTDAATEKYPLQPEAPCRERSNESNMRGQCMRCGAELGEACRDPLPKMERY
jgi:hypothetical protein